MTKKANKEAWADSRKKAYNKSETRAQQKASDKAAENAVIKERIKAGILEILERQVKAYPQNAGTTISNTVSFTDEKGRRHETRSEMNLRQLSMIYHDVTDEEIKLEKLELDRQALEKNTAINDDDIGAILENIKNGT